jgi:hypothetical protein
MPYHTLLSNLPFRRQRRVVDRYRFDDHPDLNFHVDADPDSDCHQNNADPFADPTQVLHILENQDFFYF